MITLEEVKQIVPNLKSDKQIQITGMINETCNIYQINTKLRLKHFLAQTLHESMGFYYTEEIASGKQYENRKDLGNIIKGDGVRFKGRGYIQLTGRTNYDIYGRFKKVDFLSRPELVATTYPMDVAGWYWDKKKLNTYADTDDIKTITRLINGGLNGLEDRINWYNKLNKIIK
jgi:putative chitinase